ncbi:MAG: NADH-quinone oxidoreductase subunit L, partial [Desulfobacteraceae bacterium]|nr:NADH-quinone oxidoreductase subunit L [Desulfobacteraceae bacterium]
MGDWLWLIPAFPLAGFLVLALTGSRLRKGLAALIGAGSVGAAAVVATLAGIEYATAGQRPVALTLWQWLAVPGFAPRIGLYLDGLSVAMVLVVAWVAFFIHLYSTELMAEEEGYSRFFAYMNLFVGSMLVLVLAGDLLLLYLGWEGVGLCSYLLIGFWYRDPANVRAANKAFIVTRVGDTAMAVGLFLLFTHLGTSDIQELMRRAAAQWPPGSLLAVAAAGLLLGGALGKSAQLPLQTWLPDAMAGPTPVSALIHAATMVTAGVYLIARTHVLFALAPAVQHAVAVIGALTLLLSGCSALTQRDIKRVLAYSTISQIGYMFLALGVGAWSAAIFHFMTHAFFKALLFLGAGVVILGLEHEHDMFRMGGLRKQVPLTFWTFLIGSCSLSALPLVTAGFYSKDLILVQALTSPQGGVWLWLAGLVGALLTSIYTFRMVFLTFFGEAKSRIGRKPGLAILIPLVVLAGLSLAGGFIDLPGMLSSAHGPLPALPSRLRSAAGLASEVTASAVSLAGIYLAYLLFLRRPGLVRSLAATAPGKNLHRFWFSGWGFDRLYDALLVRPLDEAA